MTISDPSRPGPTLIVSTQYLDALGAVDCAVVGFDDLMSRMVRRQGDDGSETATLPDLYIGGLVLSAADQARLHADTAVHKLLQALAVPIRIVEDTADTETVLRVVIDVLAQIQKDLSQSEQAARQDVTELRLHAERVQDNLTATEAFLHDALVPQFSCLLDWAPTEGCAELGDTPVVQPVPVPSRGVMAVEVHVAECAVGGRIQMRLTDPGGQQLGVAEQPVVSGQSGWFRFQLDAGLDGPPRDLSLELVSREATLKLSLADPGLFQDVHLTGHGAPAALRVYRGLPGLRLPALNEPRSDLPADGVSRLILPTDLGDVTPLPWIAGRLPRALRRTPDPVRIRKEGDPPAIVMRPSITRPSVAVLGGLRCERLDHLTGIVHHARTDSFPVSFAIGVAEPGTITTAAGAMKLLGEWMSVMPGGWAEVHVRPKDPISGLVDILLATAMPNAPYNSGGAAQFRGFRATGRA